jgi:hypothetical protein
MPGPLGTLPIDILIPRDAALVKKTKAGGCNVNVAIHIQVACPDRKDEPIEIVRASCIACRDCEFRETAEFAMLVQAIPVERNFPTLAVTRVLQETVHIGRCDQIYVAILVHVLGNNAVGALDFTVDYNFLKAVRMVVSVPNDRIVIFACSSEVDVAILIQIDCYNSANALRCRVDDVPHLAELSAITDIFIPRDRIVARRC